MANTKISNRNPANMCLIERRNDDKYKRRQMHLPIDRKTNRRMHRMKTKKKNQKKRLIERNVGIFFWICMAPLAHQQQQHRHRHRNKQKQQNPINLNFPVQRFALPFRVRCLAHTPAMFTFHLCRSVSLVVGAQLHFLQSDHSSSSWNAADCMMVRILVSHLRVTIRQNAIVSF